MDCSLFVLTTPLVVFTATILGFFAGVKNYERQIEKLQEYNSELEKLLENTQYKLDQSVRRLEAVSNSLDSDEI
jgi:hypothetical protein